MDENRIQEIKEKLIKINEFVSGLDPELKRTALNLLLPLYFDEKEIKVAAIKTDGVDLDPGASDDEHVFFTSFNHEKPAENVVMIAAWLYSQYGVYPITPEEVKDFATRLGITIASRADNTLRTIARDGKNLFRQVGRGWEPTLPAESHFKEFYKVKKGNKPRPIVQENK